MGDQVERAGFVGEPAKGDGQLEGRVGVGELLLDVGVAAGGLAVEQSGLDNHEASHTPAGCDHLVHHIDLDGRDGAVGGAEVGELLFEFFEIFTFENERVAGGEAVAEGIV